MKKMTFDKYCYSVRNSYLVLDDDGYGFALKHTANGGIRRLYNISFVEDGNVTISFFPWELTAESDNSEYKFCLYSDNCLYVKGTGELIFDYVDSTSQYNVNTVINKGNEVKVSDTLSNGMATFIAEKGKIQVDAPTNVGEENRKYLAKRKKIQIHFIPDENGEFSVRFELSQNGIETLIGGGLSYEQRVAEEREDYEKWLAAFTVENEQDEYAAYILWSNILAAGGFFRSDAIVMSKAGMTRLWSWDNAFNAWALAKICPEVAMQQFMMPLYLINKEGRVPDAFSVNTIEWTNVKPPVFGWIYEQMSQANAYFARKENLNIVYPFIKGNTLWWLNHRGEIPAYYHGNDSGADNSTCFDVGDCIESPELTALLAVQCEFLRKTAQESGYDTDSEFFAAQAKRLTRIANEVFFDDKLYFINRETGKKDYCDSLMPLRMLVLGDKLSKNVKDYIVNRLKTDFNSDYGFVSEALSSKKYETDGYWRGAVWPPDQIMILYPLVNIGEIELAKETAEKFIRVFKNGFFENYDGLTGKGQRCKHFCWGVAGYFLVKELLKEIKNKK